MDDGEADERMAATMMRQARAAAATAIRAKASGDLALQRAAIFEALNASHAAIMAIECWRLTLADERQKLTGEPVFSIEPVLPDRIKRKQ